MSDPIVPGLHPKILDAFPHVKTEVKARLGIDIGIQSGLRTAEMQQADYDKGRTVINMDGACPSKPMGNIITNAQPWQSWHCFGLAVDICPMNSKGQFYWWGDEDLRWREVANIAKTFGFEWGGNWTKFSGDLDHFQIRGTIPDVHTAKSILFSEDIDNLWAMV